MKNKQTAVESLIENLKLILPKSQFNDWLMQDLFKQAKQIEKEQIVDAILDNRNITSQVTLKDAEQYYNETFGGNNE